MNAFIGRPEPPDDDELGETLGPAKALWDGLTAGLSEEFAIGAPEWKSYSPKAGWTLRLFHKKRAIVYLSPARGWFLASFALGEKAVRAVLGMGLPASVVKAIEGAKKYAEGTAVRIEVKRPADVKVVRKLAAVKRNN
ncbi:MAG TPA: DUF3788 domain-containing protein [Acidobacteriota bacterium]|nr:DUF3788 domain-containing protein [Acidobacteriota bacterium]